MGLPRARRPKHQHVLTPIQERPLQQRPRLLHHLGRQPLQVQRRPALLQRQTRLTQQTLDAIVAPFLALPLRQPQQVLLEAQPLLLGLTRQLLVTAPESGQMQFLQILRQPSPSRPCPSPSSASLPSSKASYRLRSTAATVTAVAGRAGLC